MRAGCVGDCRRVFARYEESSAVCEKNVVECEESAAGYSQIVAEKMQCERRVLAMCPQSVEESHRLSQTVSRV